MKLLPLLIKTANQLNPIQIQAALESHFPGIEIQLFPELPFEPEGKFKLLHEFDNEPTYVTEEKESEIGDSDSVVLGANIPQETRHALGQIIKGALNAQTT